MPWPRVIEPIQIILTRWWFTEEGRWRSDGADPVAARTISILLSSPEYWYLHAAVTGFWSERYSTTQSVYFVWARPPSQMIPSLAADDDQASRFLDYYRAKELTTPPEVLRHAARELMDAVHDLEWFDTAAIVTVDEIDQLIEECRRRFPDGGEEFRRCIRGGS
jgi:hypothetical protein